MVCRAGGAALPRADGRGDRGTLRVDLVMEIVYGDSINGYITAVSYDNYETIGKGHPFQTALGEDGARKLDSKVTGIISRGERFISRYRAELSWSATPGS